MTAEEFEKKENWFLNKDFPLPKAGLSVSVPYSKKQMRWLMEAYANQKVLEALEKEEERIDKYGSHQYFRGSINKELVKWGDWKQD